MDQAASALRARGFGVTDTVPAGAFVFQRERLSMGAKRGVDETLQIVAGALEVQLVKQGATGVAIDDFDVHLVHKEAIGDIITHVTVKFTPWK
jgi:hypothetical protein